MHDHYLVLSFYLFMYTYYKMWSGSDTLEKPSKFVHVESRWSPRDDLGRSEQLHGLRGSNWSSSDKPSYDEAIHVWDNFKLQCLEVPDSMGSGDGSRWGIHIDA